MVINKDHKVRWLLYSLMTPDQFTKLDEIGFVFVKSVTKVIIGYNTEKVYKNFWKFRICVDKKRIPIYKEEVSIIMKAKPKKQTLKGKE